MRQNDILNKTTIKQIDIFSNDTNSDKHSYISKHKNRLEAIT